jgi:AraC-like DNA-binding protein
MDMIGHIKQMTRADTSRGASRTVEPTIAAGIVRALLELAVAKGADRAELIERCAIVEENLADLNARIPLAQWLTLLRVGSEVCGDPALALHFGEAFDIADMSVLGLMGRSVDNKAEGLELLNRFCRLVIDVETEADDRFQLVPEPAGTWMIDTRINPNESPEISETALAQMAAMAELMLPGGGHFRAVHFTHPEPAYRAEYDRIFQVPVVFDSDRNGFLMPEGWEAEPIALQPRYALNILTVHAEELLERLDSTTSLRKRVEELLASTLSSVRPSAAAIAASLGITEQTLYRRLKAEGTIFEEVLAGVRYKLARHWLGGKKMRVKDTAYRLGYSDPAAFSRAFKRWSGVSPEEYARQQNGSAE